MNELLNIAISKLDSINSGEVFLIKDLFLGYEWNRLSTQVRNTLGIIFLSYVREDPSLKITILPKSASNHQKYKKQ
ncbi:single-stranded DNA-binding protein [Clostridium psychrophilum]|uniref:single-stranded DNA-binding protein n=1 Tax=Clostridium psychrophilum TaxID=132926 RepID=UPI001C0DDD71|nr:single-stranded DNA-binding protein [Clostridium psychrophilum]MBU3182922.1 single-stranded DNA-binding protein [Clostridium psychrophilum]